MADNYLERKMEEHRSNAARPAGKRRVSPSGNKAGTVTLPYPEVHVFVARADADIVAALTGAGAHTAFCCPDKEKNKECRMLAERSGARFYPMGLDDALAQYGAYDYLIEPGKDMCVITDSRGEKRKVTSSGPIALMVSLLCGPLAGVADCRIERE